MNDTEPVPGGQSTALLNVVDNAPYGHDGRWPDLESAVAGHVPALPPAQRADILAFLAAVFEVESRATNPFVRSCTGRVSSEYEER